MAVRTVRNALDRYDARAAELLCRIVPLEPQTGVRDRPESVRARPASPKLRRGRGAADGTGIATAGTVTTATLRFDRATLGLPIRPLGRAHRRPSGAGVRGLRNPRTRRGRWRCDRSTTLASECSWRLDAPVSSRLSAERHGCVGGVRAPRHRRRSFHLPASAVPTASEGGLSSRSRTDPLTTPVRRCSRARGGSGNRGPASPPPGPA